MLSCPPNSWPTSKKVWERYGKKLYAIYCKWICLSIIGSQRDPLGGAVVGTATLQQEEGWILRSVWSLRVMSRSVCRILWQHGHEVSWKVKVVHRCVCVSANGCPGGTMLLSRMDRWVHKCLARPHGCCRDWTVRFKSGSAPFLWPCTAASTVLIPTLQSRQSQRGSFFFFSLLSSFVISWIP